MDEQSVGGASGQFRYFLDTLISPTGLAGLLVIFGLAAYALVSPRGRWIALSCMLYATSLMVMITDRSNPLASTTGGVLGAVRQSGRSLATGLLFALVPIAVTAPRG